MQLSIIENDFTVASAAISAVLLTRLLQLGLRGRFPWIVSYQFLQFIPTFAATILGTTSVLYARLFEWSCLPSLVATLMVAHELVSLLYTKFPGLRVFNQRSFRFGVVMALAAAIPSAYSTHARWHDPHFACMLWVWMEAMRVTETGVVVYLLVLFIASKRLKVRFPRNFALLGAALLLTFISDATGSTLLSGLRLHDATIYTLNIASLAVTIMINAILILFLQVEDAPEPSVVEFDETLSSRLSALQQVVTICTRNLLR
jgi:hypothetical protein